MVGAPWKSEARLLLVPVVAGRPPLAVECVWEVLPMAVVEMGTARIRKFIKSTPVASG